MPPPITLTHDDLFPKEAGGPEVGITPIVSPGAGMEWLTKIEQVLTILNGILTQWQAIKTQINPAPAGFQPRPPVALPAAREIPGAEREEIMGIDDFIKAKLIQTLKGWSAKGLGQTTLGEFYTEFKNLTLDDVINLLEGKPPQPKEDKEHDTQP